ncbi:MAG: Glycerophosphoryl diester phosphodiesterase [uncultured Solirubrobacteraceae bacterium]|uniref:Glycerophosphoryl diester phosphodiesterase n=1 Tax=uncultured Solirubrobacteraceae bacterium TaxID=1162706 RepID=A0A6J4TSH1_9ACTN|nr:MAG: Glycerophosphoryl diester phosphodiesterase [uncultured Solirubrobacteraceae bacterium]
MIGTDAPAEVIAHRGASAYAREHSFAAYDLALAQGADTLELDVRLTMDGRLVVLHDSRLLRTARDPRAIARLCVAELALLDAAVRPPTLDAVLDRYGTATRWLVELKDPSPASEHGVAAALMARGFESAATVQSFNAVALRRLRQSMPTLAVAPLYRRAPSTRRLRAVAPFAAAVGVRHCAVDMTLMLRARACGLAVRAWTANAPRDIERLVGLGVAGIITDVPDVARGVVDASPALAAAA